MFVFASLVCLFLTCTGIFSEKMLKVFFVGSRLTVTKPSKGISKRVCDAAATTEAFVPHTDFFFCSWTEASLTCSRSVSFAKLANASLMYLQQDFCWENFICLDDFDFTVLLFFLAQFC